MKSTKRILSLVAALALMFTLAACGGGDEYADSPFTGEWTSVDAIVGGQTLTDMGMSLEDMGMEMVVDLKADGTAVVSAMGEELTGEWSVDGDVAELTDDTGEVIEMEMVDGALHIDTGADAILVMEK